MMDWAASESVSWTVNTAEQLYLKLCRRTHMVCFFPNKDSSWHQVSATPSEVSDEWITGRAYLTFEEFNLLE